MSKTTKGAYVCDVCGHVENYEREVHCWECGKGEMIYTRVEPAPTFGDTPIEFPPDDETSS